MYNLQTFYEILQSNKVLLLDLKNLHEPILQMLDILPNK